MCPRMSPMSHVPAHRLQGPVFLYIFYARQSKSIASRMTTSLFFLQIDGNSLLDSGQAPRPTSSVIHGIFLL